MEDYFIILVLIFLLNIVIYGSATVLYLWVTEPKDWKKKHPWRKWRPKVDKFIEVESEQVKSLIRVNDIMYKALKELSRLGNGEQPGNSTGNTIAQKALEEVQNEDST